MAREFILVRIARMRGVDLSLFEFDYDLTWMGFFLTPEKRILGRYGGRDAESSDGLVSLAGLRYSMKKALARHRAGKADPSPTRKPFTVESLSAAKTLPDSACVKCHEVYDLRRRSLLALKKWSNDELWVYPLPENVGLRPDLVEGDRLTAVTSSSPAAKAGLKKGDRLSTVNGVSISSFADLQYALHRAPAKGSIPLSWIREGTSSSARLTLDEGWRRTDLSWRWSMRAIDPAPCVQGDDLSVEEKKALGLSRARLALCQGPFVSQPARQAGIRQGDVIVGVGGKELEMSGRQFSVYIRLTYRPGDRVVFNVLRDGKRVDVTLTLRGR